MTVIEVPSETQKGKVYTVRIFDNGVVKCDCPRFAFKKKHEPDCKHIRMVLLSGSY